MKKNKIKTHKASKKRFKLTATGKVMHYKQGNNHLKANKSGAQKKRRSGDTELGSKTQAKKIINLMNE
ncbi:MAG: 50S ribosomal protein L35 [candidate division WS6 bacterium OLB20]|uniref:Large ribosomal subunit protein bL35 n=1 Tax=candidate division WS6 bacterium OLB20 TaxID=1617426 RepID=A0A136LXY0_9BACT|nr:MAG: 50S ribosomal protein L35 [candidate division WS6 bacterium OLB20]